MIRIEQTTKARRKLFPSDEYCINKNGEYIYLTKVELMKIVCDLKLLGIADVVCPKGKCNRYKELHDGEVAISSKAITNPNWEE
jgi:hypothetical protein